MGQSVQALNCLYANVQSLLNKKSEIELAVAQTYYDLLFFTEVWIPEEAVSTDYYLEGYQTPVICAKARGGTCIYIKTGLSYSEVHPPNPVNESSWITVMTGNNRKRLYACIYRSPNSNSENNYNLLENLAWANRSFNEVVVVGDFNFPEINWNNSTCGDMLGSEFLDAVVELGWEQIVNEHTRFRDGQRPSMLDLLFVNDGNLVRNISFGSPFGKSDHLRIQFEIANEFTKITRVNRDIDMKKLDMNKFTAQFNSVDWISFLENNNIETSYNKLVETITETLADCAPLRKKFPKQRAPWSNRQIGRLSKKKRQKWDRYKYTKSPTDYFAYTQALKIFNDAKELAIRNYENNIIANKKTCPRKYYSYVGRKNKYKDDTIVLQSGLEVVTDDEKCANILNNFFSSVFTVDQVPDNEISEQPTRESLTPDFIITEDKVREKIMSLNTNKSTGPDGIPISLMKKGVNVFVPILTKLYTISYERGELPKKMKNANIIPIHKSNDRKSPNNYRPVSITSVISKIMEGIIMEELSKFVEDNNIIHESQHGFSKGKSTSSNLLKFWDDVTTMVEAGSSFSIIYTDLAKAFDKVPHNLLIIKLQRLGIGGKLLQWLKCYLYGRTQQVLIKGKVSVTTNVSSGVPQGGVLSGLLFALYINDLPEIFRFCKVSLYADDAKLYAPNNDPSSVNMIQEDINRLLQWCRLWKLQLNASKCFYLFHEHKKHTDQLPPIYYIEDEIMQKKEHCKDLGIIISSDCKFHLQIMNVRKKAIAEINRIRRCFISRNPMFLSNMYKQYVRPHMEYCVEVWNPVYSEDVNKLEKIQNKMTRLLRGGRILSPDQRNSRLCLKSHRQRRLRGDLINMFKHLSDAAYFQMRNDTRLRGNEKSLKIPNYRTNVRRHSFSFRSVKHWNSLPDNVVLSESVNEFKVNLDRFFCQQELI